MDLGLLITALCTGLGPYQPACGSAVQATLVQSGTAAQVDLLNKYVTNEGTKYFHLYVTPYTGETVWGGGAVIYKVYKSRQVSREFRLKSYADALRLNANPQGGSVNMVWRF